jgi:thiol:disulfide interchange protein DsbC
MKRFYSIIASALLPVLLLALSAHAFAPKKGDKDCIECHKLDKKEAEVFVKKVVPTGVVTDIKISPIKGVWQIEVDAGEGKRGSLYLDFSKKYLVAGQIVPVETLGKQPPARKVDASKIPLGDALVVGAKDAAKKIIVFTDPDCPYCRELHTVMKRIVAKRNDIAFALIMNPLPMHKDAYKKSQAVLCSKSPEMLDDAFSGKAVPEPPASCTADAVERGKALAKSLDFQGTPALVREDGTVLSGFLPEEKMLEWIDKKQ